MSVRVPQYIIRVTAERFKNIRVVDFILNRHGITSVSGGNGAGKTSVLDAIWLSFQKQKKIDPKLIRQGEKDGLIKIETNTHIVTRTFDQRGTTLKIESKDNGLLHPKPEDWLREIAGPLGADPLEFKNLTDEKQFETVKGLVKLEADIDDLQTRTALDRQKLKELKADARKDQRDHDAIRVDYQLPEQPIDVDALLSESREIDADNRKIDEAQRARDRQDIDLNLAENEIKQLQNRHNELSEELARLSRHLDAKRESTQELREQVEKREPLPARRDRAEVTERIRTSSAENQRIADNNANRKRREALDLQIRNNKDEQDKLNEAVRQRRVKLATTLQKAEFPVKGLSFDIRELDTAGEELDNPKKTVTYNGIPLREASSAEQIRVSAEIAMAGKPDLRFLLIREGSLLDDNSMDALEELAAKYEYQILMEVVDKTGDVGIYMEDGTIKQINAPDAPAPKKTAAKKTAAKKTAKQGELIK